MSKLEMSPDIIEALLKLSMLVDSNDAFERTLQTVADLSISAIPGCDAAGVTVRVNGKDSTAAATDAFAREIDSIQYDTGEGPCLEAIESGEFRAIAAITDEPRWPKFSKRAAEQGLKSSLSFPVQLEGTVGALNLYAKRERAFEEEATELGEIFARQASIAVHNAKVYSAARRLTEQLNEALESRDLIGQAKGILMEREGVTDAQAFEMLKSLSQHSNVKLREVAQKLVEDRNLPAD